MDPITAGLNLATAVLALGGKIWDATPPPLQQQNAADWAKFAHNISAFMLTIQEKINAGVGK